MIIALSPFREAYDPHADRRAYTAALAKRAMSVAQGIECESHRLTAAACLKGVRAAKSNGKGEPAALLVFDQSRMARALPNQSGSAPGSSRLAHDLEMRLHLAEQALEHGIAEFLTMRGRARPITHRQTGAAR